MLVGRRSASTKPVPRWALPERANALGRGFWILVSHGPEMADAAVDGERPPQPLAEDAEHADDVPGAEAPFDFAAMRPAGALAKVARHEMFAQPPNKCQLGCCKLNSDFSENNAKWTGKEELGENRRERTGLELEQVQLTEQRLFYRRSDDSDDSETNG